MDDLLDHIVHTYVDVGSTSILVAVANPERRMLFIQNDSADEAYIMFSRPAIMHQGLRLNPSGASAMFTVCNSSLCATDLYAITKPNKVVRILVAEGY